MNRSQVVGQPTSQQHLQCGINILANLLAPTLGPTGGHIISETERKDKYEMLTDSSVALRRILSLGTPQLDIGAMSVRSMVWRVGQQVGDGGATTAILMRAIFNEGVRLLAADINAMMLNRGLKTATEIALEALSRQSIPVSSEDQLAAVARTITQEDSLAAVLGEMTYLLGPDAYVIIEKFVAPYLRRRYIAGSHYAAQISSMYFYTDSARKIAVAPEPAVAIIDGRLTTTEQVLPLMEAAIANGRKALVIIARDVSGEALGLLVHNHQLDEEKRKLQILAVKLTSLGAEQEQARLDLELMTGATTLGPNAERNAAAAQPSDLGEAQRAEFADKALVIVANRGEREAIQAEVNKIRNRLATLTLNDEDRPKLIKRLATLTGGVGELKIGAYTKTQRAQLENSAERALKVLSAAQKTGVVPGGGASLLHCAIALRTEMTDGDYPADVRSGMEMLANALAAPLSQIVSNTGLHRASVICHRIEEAGPGATYDALSGQVVDASTSGILDVTDVVKTVLQTAVSGAMMALSTDAIVYHRKPETVINPT